MGVGNLSFSFKPSGISTPQSILFPDVPLSKELKKAVDEKYVAFIGDI
jgi:DNA polymerase II small subunit/DNA polymerase delta subunit B